MISKKYVLTIHYDITKEYTYRESQKIDAELHKICDVAGGENIETFFGNPAYGPYITIEMEDLERAKQLEKELRYYLYMHDFKLLDKEV